MRILAALLLLLWSATALATSFYLNPTGHQNKFRNGTFEVWQRGTIALQTNAYTADGWLVTQPGAQGTCAQDAGASGADYSLSCNGAVGNTDSTFNQRIESFTAQPLAGQQVTVQFQFKQDLGSVAPRVSTCAPQARDDFSSCQPDLAPTQLNVCAAGAWCLEAYTFTASGNASAGYQVSIDCGPLTAIQHCWLGNADIRVTQGLFQGINDAAPEPELRPLATELALCQRYFYRWQAPASGRVVASMIGIDSAQISFGALPVTMRAIPQVSDANLSDLVVLDPASTLSGTPSASDVTAGWKPEGYGLLTFKGIAGAPLMYGNPAVIYSRAGQYLVDFNAEL